MASSTALKATVGRALRETGAALKHAAGMEVCIEQRTTSRHKALRAIDVSSFESTLMSLACNNATVTIHNTFLLIFSHFILTNSSIGNRYMRLIDQI